MNRLIFSLVFLYYSIPKIDLLSFPGLPTGIRIQDIISLSMFLLLFNGNISKNNLILFLILILHSFYSIFFWGNLLSFLGVIRFIEYYAVALGIYYLIQKGSFNIFFSSIFIYLVLISTLQYIEIFPNFDPGRGTIFSKEFSGSFGNAAELSYFLIASVFIFNLVNQKIDFRSFISLMVLLNGVVAPILGFLVIFWDYIKKINFLFGVLIFCSILVAIIYTRDIFFAGIDFLRLVYDNIQFSGTSFEDIKSSQRDVTDTQSLSNRVGKWTSSVSLLYQYPLGFIFGFGIYSQGGALDGGILRFLYEFGFLWFLYLIYAMNRLSSLFLLILLSVNLLFDAYMSSVVMPFLIVAFLQLKNKEVIESRKVENH